ncbi:pseudouridine synthase [Saccharospirillum mangrovi]|uniref:pseudouridine synthase n=1 Tax=Saccharospirillum mangrovi TaxID=2161747 RepID=UPI001300727E|nr:pseudouridine synthase [Saccharospirillum mangrovi]
MSESALRVLYEDEHLLAVDKPADLLMHPSWLDRAETDTLAGRVKTYWAGAKVHTIHRLDRPTSGVVLIARTDAVARALADAFRDHKVDKTYWAIARGFTEHRFDCDHPLKEELDAIADAQASPDKAAQPARTRFRRLGISTLDAPVSRYPQARFSLLECRPQTGRKHQIRRHLKHLRHPILGDTRYGDRHQNRWAREHLPFDSLMLRAVQLGFEHPITGMYTVISSGLSPQWQAVLANLGWAGLGMVSEPGIQTALPYRHKETL